MSTDIHGGIECRHSDAGTDFYEDKPWITAMDLWPLYDQSDYAAFGCLFGVRNYAGFRPLAADRGLPPDLSRGLREQLEPSVDAGDLTSATWVSWAEIAALDPISAPDYYIGPDAEFGVPVDSVPVGAGNSVTQADLQVRHHKLVNRQAAGGRCGT